MHKQPLVSICMLSFNHEQYIATAIQSVLDQTYQNWELIIVDNASTDNTAPIIEKYAQTNTRIQFIPLTKNTMVSYGANHAMKQAQGDYIAVLSADDYFEANKLEVQLNHMLKNNLSNTFTWVNVVNDHDNRNNHHPMARLFNRELSSKALQTHFVEHGNTLCATTAMLHKSILEKYGNYDHRLLQTQDFELWLRIIKHEPIHLLPQKLSCYRVRNDGQNLSMKYSDARHNQSSFEVSHYIAHVLNFDLEVLSNATQTPCTPENKHKNLFYYYKNNGKKPEAAGILLAMHRDLGPSFEFPSTLYQDFFETYSGCDIYHSNTLKKQTKNVIKRIFQALKLR
jgi:O-antigen biosynthesis protein